ncbi:unnamed protein product [Phytomonas sp. EM1]|nr:unnamed protein product [Phytomonas sp. EM1]|eukprot:CCW63748.1 unnamed protein product [Phytomonas sp. isolate EM1]
MFQGKILGRGGRWVLHSYYCMAALMLFALLSVILTSANTGDVGRRARHPGSSVPFHLNNVENRFLQSFDLTGLTGVPSKEFPTSLFMQDFQAPRCNNGGEVDDDRCICPIYYTGSYCSERQCPNSVNGKRPYRILPVNPVTKLCDDCDLNDFEGLNCQLCRRDAACGVYGGNNSQCNRSIAIRGNSKQFQCHLKPSYFVDMMSGGRNVSVDILLNCSTPDGTAFSAGKSGVCHMALYRTEDDKAFVDPFFRCETTRCSMRYATKAKSETSGEAKAKTWIDGVFANVRVAGRVLMLALCASLVLLGGIARSLGYKRLKRFTMVIGAALCATAALYIFLMVLSMRMADPEAVVVYECEKTSCACAEDPPERYRPRCSETDILVNKVLPSIQNGVRIECDIASGGCELTLTDIMLVFDVDCEAAECVDESQFPLTPENDDDDATASKLHLLLKALFVSANLSLVGVLIHWIYLRRRSKERIREFLLLFHVDAAPAMADDGLEYDDDGFEDANMPVVMPPTGNLPSMLTPPTTPYLPRKGGDVTPSPSDSHGGLSTRLLENSPSRPRAARSWSRGITASESSIGMMDSFLFESQEEVERIRALMRSPLQLRVEGLRYTLKSPSFAPLNEDTGVRVILHQIHFTVRSGDVLAIMGPSGAGKTTLLDLLSVRAKSGVVHGDVLLNGSLVSTTGGHASQYRNIIGYVSQEDTLLPALTVRQTLEYAARLKLPTAFSKRTIDHIVDRMIQICKLQQCEHTMVGGGGSITRGISGGERRRVSVAVELLANPRILFLDEPTSGLDAVSAKRMIEAVVKLAKDSSMRSYAPYFFAFNPIVVFSIHQPSQEIFDMFDNVLLLSKGMSVYCGPAREAAATLEQRVYEAFGGTRVIPLRTEHNNEAEYLMKLEELLDDNVRLELQQQDIRCNSQRYPEEWWMEPSVGREDNRTEETESPSVAEGYEILRSAADLRVYYMNVYQQFALLTSRSVASLISSFHLVMSHAAVVVCMASLMCGLYKEQTLDLAGALNREGSVTFLLLVTSFVSLSCLEHLILERKLFIVERENGFYSTLPYFLSKLVVDIFPLRVIPSVVLSSAIYFSMGFRTDSGEHFMWFIVIITLFSVCMTLMVMCVGIVMESFGASALVSSVFILWFFVFGGSMVQAETIPYYLKPFQIISPFFLSFESLMINELDKQSCVFSPTDETGKKSSNSISIQCRQYLFNVGLKPARFSLDVMQLGLICFLLVLVAWILLAMFTKLVR